MKQPIFIFFLFILSISIEPIYSMQGLSKKRKVEHQDLNKIGKAIYADWIQNGKESLRINISIELDEKELAKLITLPIDEDGNTLLLLSAKLGLIDQFRDLLNLHSDIAIENNLQENVVDIASRYNHFTIVKIFMDVDSRNLSFNFNHSSAILKNTPLHWAAQYGNVEALGTFIKKTASIDDDIKELFCNNLNGENSNRHTPLHIAAVHGHVDIIRLLFAAGANYFAGDPHTSPIDLAAQNGQTEVLNFFINEVCDGDIELSINRSLGNAAREGNVKILKTLIASKANVKSRDAYQQWTPLHLAAKAGQCAAMDILIAEGAKIEAQNRFGITPLHEAARENQNDATRILIENKANVNPQSVDESTPLHAAALYNSFDTLKTLIFHRASIDVPDRYKRTALHLAATHSHGTDVLRALIEAKANPNALNDFGETPLHKAVNAGNADAVNALIGSEAHKTVRDIRDRTPLDYARERKHTAIVTILKSS